MTTLHVPFVENPDDRCVPATIGMILAYFEPESSYTMDELERLCGYRKGQGSWPMSHMIALADMGYDLSWIQSFGLRQFSHGPEAYLKQILSNPGALDYQITHSDLEAEAKRARDYLDRGLPYENRRATFEDIRSFLGEGWLVRLEVNARTLSRHDGYEGHSILVVGYDKQGVTIHNPDGAMGNKPNQYVDWEILGKAWAEFGGSYSLYAFKK